MSNEAPGLCLFSSVIVGQRLMSLLTRRSNRQVNNETIYPVRLAEMNCSFFLN